MIKLREVSKPSTLQFKGDIWRDTLLDKVKNSEEVSISNLFQKVRNYSDILDALKQRSLGKCGYCEALLGVTSANQIEHFLIPTSAVAKIAEGDIVEMVAGPFRGETAKVTHIDDSKEEITVELDASLVPIPITVRGEQVRVVKRKDEDNKELRWVN